MGSSGFQYIHFPLPSLTYAAGGRSVVRLRELPFEHMGRLVHVVGFHFEIEVDATWTTEPDHVGYNALLSRVELFDGQNVRFSGNGNDMRHFERLECGKLLVPDPIETTTSTNLAYLERTLYLGPPKMAGFPTDFCFPAAALENGELRIQWGALTDLSADTTANTTTVYVTAICVLLDEIRVPPFYERQVYSLSGADSPIPGQCLAAFGSLANSNAYGAITAGDFNTVTVTTSAGDLVPGMDASTLWKLHQVEMEAGQIGGCAGEPRDGTYDVNTRTVNPDTPTALLAQILDQNPIFWVPPGGRISKLPGIVSSSMRLRWTGANGSGTILHLGRFLAQAPEEVARIAERAARRLNKRGQLKLKMLQDGRPGPFVPFLPYAYK